MGLFDSSSDDEGDEDAALFTGAACPAALRATHVNYSEVGEEERACERESRLNGSALVTCAPNIAPSARDAQLISPRERPPSMSWRGTRETLPLHAELLQQHRQPVD